MHSHGFVVQSDWRHPGWSQQFEPPIVTRLFPHTNYMPQMKGQGECVSVTHQTSVDGWNSLWQVTRFRPPYLHTVSTEDMRMWVLFKQHSLVLQSLDSICSLVFSPCLTHLHPLPSTELGRKWAPSRSCCQSELMWRTKWGYTTLLVTWRYTLSVC